ncbi:MAG TPA: DUF1015 domain-containing protein [Anaerolineaceae bacterium]|nr:DUF1015 domain-containing protein [Anaerolineaceae bacterium]HPN52938.1 DUF1015 domain-containing protein [Anaerolineaceae bacterium]
MTTYESLGIQIPDILLPKPGTDLTKWAVIACDQFTSEPEYWEEVKNKVGEAPSTYHITLPEVFLGQPEEEARLHTVQSNMRRYLDTGVLTHHNGMIYVERTVDGKTRRGIMLCLDLEKYDFNKGSQTLIRATEGTILDRLPPRIKIREGAQIELPHILVLVDDPQDTLIGPISAMKASLPVVYDFDLMLDSGHLSGYSLASAEAEKHVVGALTALQNKEDFKAKYGVGDEKGVLLFAVGDGNHSLATAKSIWEKVKATVGMDHPARYALVEIENVHDAGLEFEPIHRVLFDIKKDILAAAQTRFGARLEILPCASAAEMVQKVDEQSGPDHLIGFISPSGFSVLKVAQPTSNLPVGTLQPFLDEFLKAGGAEKIDYVHGEEVTCRLGAQPHNVGFYLPGMHKGDLFKTVILDGVLPRKTFSMGEAKEKRFYMECRQIAR